MDRTGIVLAFSAFIFWGIMPVYWKQLDQVPALKILSHRIFWSFVFLFLYFVVRKSLNSITTLFSDRKRTLNILIRALLIGSNWFIFVWAINTGKVVESSLGYYISPLFSVILGVLVLKERLTRLQYVSFLLACAGVAVLAFGYGRLPWVSLLLAGTFGMYGLLKKLSPSGSFEELFAELLFIAPLAGGFLLFRVFQGAGVGSGVPVVESVLLVAAGVATAAPLILFGYAAKRVPLSTLGFIQYLAPTSMFLLGVFLFKELFSWIHLAGFFCIWAALGLFSYSAVRVKH